jgi:hypothetical protein
MKSKKEGGRRKKMKKKQKSKNGWQRKDRDTKIQQEFLGRPKLLLSFDRGRNVQKTKKLGVTQWPPFYFLKIRKIGLKWIKYVRKQTQSEERLEVRMGIIINITVFWVMTPCYLVTILHQTWKARSFLRNVDIYQTISCRIQ